LKQANNGKTPAFEESLLDSSDKSSVYLSLKNYGLEGGLSTEIFEQKEQFELRGPMGKGLGISSQS